MIQCVRKGSLTHDSRNRFMKQIDVNQAYIRKLVYKSLSVLIMANLAIDGCRLVQLTLVHGLRSW